jgi:hypothetical protein
LREGVKFTIAEWVKVPLGSMYFEFHSIGDKLGKYQVFLPWKPPYFCVILPVGLTCLMNVKG